MAKKEKKKYERGIVYFTYDVDHGENKKGDKVEMHFTTAKALEKHKIGKVGEDVDQEVTE